MNKEKKTKINALVRLINDYLDVLDDFNPESKLEYHLKLIRALVSWY